MEFEVYKMINQLKIILICVFINVTVICLILIAYVFFHMDEIKRNMKISDYSTYYTKLINNSDVHSKLSIFPDKIRKKQVVDFQYLTNDKKNHSSYFFYLVMDYDEDSYLKEYKRINKISSIYEEKLSTSSIYITIYDSQGTYEYAILDEKEDKIIYVYNQLTDWSKTQIEKDYRIDLKNMDNKLIGYNIYVDNDS